MKLSLQKKINARTVYHKRKEVIFRERLHINDTISYNKFEMLYQKYGTDMKENEFARYFFAREDQIYDKAL